MAAAALCSLAVALTQSASASHTTTEHVSIGSGGGNGAFDSFHRASSSDGLRAIFETGEPLVAGDADTQFDIYERMGTTTTLLSTGSAGGNGAFETTFRGTSSNATRVFFETREALEPGDSDSSTDIYERSGGTTTRISAGTINGNGAFDATFRGSSDDGARVFFETREQLVAADTDSSRDVYQRFGSTTTLISAGAINGNGAFHASFADSSASGLRVLFDTREQLTSDDTDSSLDLYERSSGATTRVSASATGSNGAFDAFFAGASSDGTRVFFHSKEQLGGGDSDSAFDVWERASGATTRISTGSGGGNGAFDALLQGTSSDGTRVFFETAEAIEATDTDTHTDIYERFSGATSHLSRGPTSGVGVFPALYKGATADGSRVYFETSEPLVAADTDGVADVYERTGSTTTQVSVGPDGGNGPQPAGFDFVSSTGTRVLFHTEESLVSADSDSFNDVYERASGTTTIVSGGLSGGNGNFFADFTGASSDGSRAFVHTDEQLTTSDTDSAQDVYVASTAPLYPRPGGGTPLRIPLVPAFVACTSPNSTHVTPALGGGSQDGSCNPPVQESALLTTSTVGSGSGSARLDVLAGNPATPADEADVSLTTNVTDVRKKSDGTDYVGNVLLATELRITDRGSGSFENTPATVSDLTFSVPVGCVATGSTSVGSTCAITTTVDTLVPGFAVENRRAVLAAFQLQIKDAGADGNVTVAGCPPTCGTGDEQVFLRQGIFTP